MDSKRCTRCKLVLPLNQFSKHAGHKDGYATRCKTCRSAIRRKPRSIKQIEQEKLLSDGLQRCTQCDKIKSLGDFYTRSRNIYRAAERCKVCTGANKRIYRAKNRELVNKRSRNWCKRNPEKRRATIERRRARKQQAQGSFSGDDIIALQIAQEGLCIYCKTSIKEGYHADHIMPLSRGGSNYPSNIQLLCSHCNISKQNKTHEEFLIYRKAINA